MRLAAPVTNTDSSLSVHVLDHRVAVHFDLFRFHAFGAGSGSRPVQFAHNQKKAVLELSSPDQTPMVRGLQDCDATPAPAIESIITDHCIVSMVANTRPRNSLETCRSSCDMLSTELTATAARESARKSSASRKSRIWLKIT